MQGPPRHVGGLRNFSEDLAAFGRTRRRTGLASRLRILRGLKIEGLSRLRILRGLTTEGLSGFESVEIARVFNHSLYD